MVFSNNPNSLKTEGTFHYTITYEDGDVIEEIRDFDFFNNSSGW
ncbi:hypothetical protein [uncultured Maribacter sp.]|nr:hypothetical protein [uncultured Maribacter sp.]